MSGSDHGARQILSACYAARASSMFNPTIPTTGAKSFNRAL